MLLTWWLAQPPLRLRHMPICQLTLWASAKIGPRLHGPLLRRLLQAEGHTATTYLACQGDVPGFGWGEAQRPDDGLDLSHLVVQVVHAGESFMGTGPTQRGGWLRRGACAQPACMGRKMRSC